MTDFVYTIEFRVDEDDVFEYGTTWATAQAAIEALEADAITNNQDDDEAHAQVYIIENLDTIEITDDLEVANSEMFGFVDAKVTARQVRG